MRAAWRRCRMEYLALNPFCQECGKEQRMIPACEVDHVKPLREGGAPYDWDNLRGLCKPHHSQKTRGSRKLEI
jgi:5-methylcytosine-specific restriction protein A